VVDQRTLCADHRPDARRDQSSDRAGQTLPFVPSQVHPMPSSTGTDGLRRGRDMPIPRSWPTSPSTSACWVWASTGMSRRSIRTIPVSGAVGDEPEPWSV
jgi:hypothetical protein